MSLIILYSFIWRFLAKK